MVQLCNKASFSACALLHLKLYMTKYGMISDLYKLGYNILNRYYGSGSENCKFFFCATLIRSGITTVFFWGAVSSRWGVVLVVCLYRFLGVAIIISWIGLTVVRLSRVLHVGIVAVAVSCVGNCLCAAIGEIDAVNAFLVVVVVSSFTLRKLSVCIIVVYRIRKFVWLCIILKRAEIV